MSDKEEELTWGRLRQVLHYDPETGIFTRLIRTCRKIAPGSVAGGYRADGYLRIAIDGNRYYGHRLAWFWMTGE
jgi:hypothetical protein